MSPHTRALGLVFAVLAAPGCGDGTPSVMPPVPSPTPVPGPQDVMVGPHTGPTQITFLAADANSIAAGNDADASGYSALQTKSAEIIAESRAIAQFFERDTDPGFAAQMRTFLRDWLADPGQNLGGFLKRIQDDWDSSGLS